jgi:hypothetical protein
MSTPMLILSGAGMAFTGAAPAFREKLVDKVHGAGAISAILFGFIELSLRNQWIPLTIFGVMMLFINYPHRIKNATWWVEVAAFVCIIFGLIITI